MIFLVLLGKILFLFPENMILHLKQKMEDDFSENNTRKYDIFFKLSEKMVFSKRAVLGHDLSCIIWKDEVFSPKHDIFSLGRKWEMTFLKKYIEIWYFLCTRTGVTDVESRHSAKKIKAGLIPQKYTYRWLTFQIDILERAPVILCSVLSWRPLQAFSCITLEWKNPGNLIYRIEIWLLLQFIGLEIFYND